MAKYIKKVPSKDYKITWNKAKSSCSFSHKNGKGGELGCGVTDSVSVYSDGGKIIVLSVNYPARYACIETYTDDQGPDELVLAEPKDIEKIFGDNFSSTSKKKIAEKLAKEL